MLKVTDDEATIIHSIPYERTERVGILPGFDFDNFPFIMRHHYHLSQPETKTKKMGEGKYTDWRSHHLRIT